MAANTELRRVNLALQGGGSHGAFTWGVLDRLLEDASLRAPLAGVIVELMAREGAEEDGDVPEPRGPRPPLGPIPDEGAPLPHHLEDAPRHLLLAQADDDLAKPCGGDLRLVRRRQVKGQ